MVNFALSIDAANKALACSKSLEMAEFHLDCEQFFGFMQVLMDGKKNGIVPSNNDLNLDQTQHAPWLSNR